MTTATRSASKDGLLRNVLRADSIVCLISGLLLVLESGVIAPLMGLTSSIPLVIIGLVVLVVAYDLAREASRETLNVRTIRVFFTLNLVWVAGSLLILATNAFGLSTEGRWIVMAMADLVAVFAVCEFIGLRRLA